MRQTELFRQLGRDGRCRGAGINGELKGAAAVCVHLDKNQWLGRMSETNRDFRFCRATEILDSFWIIKTNLTRVIINRDAKVLQKVVAQIAIDFCADGFADLVKIDNANIDIGEFGFTDGE